MQKNNQLAVIKKQNVLQKFIARIGNMINRGKKFQDEVIVANVVRIRDEVLPRIASDLEVKMVDFSIEMYNRRMEIRDKKEQQKTERAEIKEQQKIERAEIKANNKAQREEAKEERKKEREARKAQRKEDWDRIKAAVKNRTQHTVDTIVAKGREAKVAVLEIANNHIQKALEKSLDANEEKNKRLNLSIDQGSETR